MSKTPMEVYRAALDAAPAAMSLEAADERAINAVHAHARREALNEAAIRGRIAQLEEKVVDIEIRALLNASPGSGKQS